MTTPPLTPCQCCSQPAKDDLCRPCRRYAADAAACLNAAIVQALGTEALAKVRALLVARQSSQPRNNGPYARPAPPD